MADRPKIAAITTVYHKFSHTQHIVDRFLEGYGWNGRHHRPEMDLVSLYVDQVDPDPEADRPDLSRDREARFPQMTIYPTVADALTLGGSDLAVDGVLLVAEHGSYNRNEKGQHLYPRYELFKQIASVYRTTGKTAPVFNDKHLSWNWDWCQEMYDISQELDFAFMAGSSLPVTWRTPSVEFPSGVEVEEAVSVCYGGVDSYDFHGLETLQCMVERRKSGESGVKWVQAYRDEKFWQAHADGVWSRALFEANLCRSHTLKPARPGFNNPFPSIDEMKELVKNPVAYQYEHEDGLLSTMLMMSGLVEDFNFAARIKGQDEPFSTQMYLPMPPARATLANFFSPLVNNVEQMFLTGKATYPIERTLLTSGLVIGGVDSLHQEQVKVETPHLKIAYQSTEEPTFWRT
ncbi:MAG: hypothetical protein HOL51_28410 [Gemmatimonadetes bacterium]|jgi:hypothetical protein|nr:hypothetical protein [Gemmatimonadota bacterium]MBT5452206.1 hypothetical protein [Gemmatimonadota bacterium]MBT6621085.1 hypothetical protein [Gemmatimonadota bacterium]MBT6906187.1 hypothetical protein [Gemmatimonadota bacterium]MBT7418924.1 hypothetical protein [Gemmatimonadota bacterium]